MKQITIVYRGKKTTFLAETASLSFAELKELSRKAGVPSNEPFNWYSKPGPPRQKSI